MSKDDVTLYASLFTAIAFFVNLWVARRGEARKVQRELLAPMLADLGDGLHAIVACSNIIAVRAKASQPIDKWVKSADTAKRAIGSLRRKSRYALWGLDEGLRVLMRVPSWIRHYDNRPEQAAELLRQADRLREALDDAIRNSYLKGRAPSLWERARVRRRARMVRTLWTQSAQDSSEEDDVVESQLLTTGPREQDSALGEDVHPNRQRSR